MAAHLPQALPHLPERRRTFAADAIHRDVDKVRMNDVLQELLEEMPLQSLGGCSWSLGAIGKQIESLGRASQSDFVEVVDGALRRRWVRRLQRLDEAAHCHGSYHSEWWRDLQAQRGVLIEALRKPPGHGGSERDPRPGCSPAWT